MTFGFLNTRRAPFPASALACVLALAGLLTPALSHSTVEAPALMLAKVYQAGTALADYWVSEKYDGVRGYWDGQQLWTRGGQRVAAPAWFTAGWPSLPMDGELWAGRGQFAAAVSTVRQQVPDDAAWRGMRFMVFDLPAQGGPFSERHAALNLQLGSVQQPWVQAVAQTHLPNHAALQFRMARTVQEGGEGLMLHRGASLYQATRSDDLLKFKPYEDSEARVIAHIAGRGKYAGQMGALVVEVAATADQPAQRFKLGSGFTDALRLSPPAVGSVLTFRYRGRTARGVPRFASFMRMAAEQPG